MALLLTAAFLQPYIEDYGEIPVYGGLAVAVSLLVVVLLVLLRRKPSNPEAAPVPVEVTEAPGPPEAPRPPEAPLPLGAMTARDVPPAEPSAAHDSGGPRRAISLPKNESDGSGRASEQTIKRMTVADIEKAESEVKGPRADEVPGNPILADGEVKVRCLACDKKMKADASKFRKQRRCPACKAEPFRYVTAI